MATEAATALVSNHSYGFTRGWSNDGTDNYWYGSPSVNATEDYLFGFYSADARDWDQIAYNAPYYLICKSAGNDRNDNEDGTLGHYAWISGAWTWSTAARNPDGQYDCIGVRGGCKNVLTVGAVEDMPNGYNGPSSVVMSSFSSWGPVDDGRIKPDICANGVALYSADNTGNTDYISKSGTSMSTPSVTGSVALLQKHWHNLTGTYMRSSTMKAIIINTADEAGTSIGPDYQYGWGLMNTEKAALKITQDQTINVVDERSLSNGATYNRTVYSNGLEPLKVTICWLDPPGTPVAAQLDPITPMLKNDLDLRITRSGTTYYPWKLSRNNPTNAATKTGENNVDNVEVVYIANPTAGNYTITVDHDGTLSSAQRYALVISGISVASTPPVAQFKVNKTDPNNIETVYFTDLSSNGPTSWTWSFSPSTVTYVGGTNANSQNPQVKFNNAGLYTVSLTATNAFGSDAEVKTNFISVSDCSISAFPYTQDFDSWTSSAPSATCTMDGAIDLDDCWTNMSGDDIDWDILSGATGSSNTGPSDDHGVGGNYMYLESSNCWDKISYLVSPMIDISGLNNPQLRFWYHMYGAEMGTMSVQVSTDRGQTWSSDLWSLSGNQGNSWQEAVISLSSYSTTKLLIRISGLTGLDFHSDMAIDDFTIQGAPASAVEWTGVTSSNWGTSTNWDGNAVPLATDNVIIPNTAPIWPVFAGNLTLGSTCGDIILEGSSVLTVTGNISINAGSVLTTNTAGTIYVGGNWTNNGSFNAGTGTVQMNGSSIAGIVGAETFYNLIISNTSDVITAGSDLTIDNKLTLRPNACLTVNGALTNNNGVDGLLIESDATGTGSLMHNTDGVAATVERYLVHGIGNAQWYYHQACAPVSGAVLEDFDMHPGYTFAYEYLPSADGLPPTADNLSSLFEYSTPIDPMTGILISTYFTISNVTTVFSGTLQNGNMSTPITAGMTNMVGNPYPSAISWDNLNNQAGIYDRVYIWSPAAGNFAVYVEGTGGNESCRYIQSGQSFFIESSTASSFSFTNADRIQHLSTYLKNQEELTPNYLVLETQGGNFTSDKAFIRFYNEGDETYDENQEAKKVFSIHTEEATELYTISSDNIPLTVNSMPDIVDGSSYNIPLQFKAGTNAIYSIIANNIESFDQETSLILEDKSLTYNNLHDLKSEPEYIFLADPSDDYDRFVLHISREMTDAGEGIGSNENIIIFSKDHQIVIINKNDTEISDVSVLNTNGQLIRDYGKLRGEINSLAFDNTPGLYLVKVIAGNRTITAKVFIQ